MGVKSVQAAHAIPARAAAAAAERFPDRVAFRYRHAGEWRTQTFAEVGERVDQLALGLVARGLEPGDRICILANTRPEWTLVSLAISRAGGVVVPMYPTNSPSECEWVVRNSEAKMVVCEGADQAAKIEAVRGSLERLELVIVMQPSGDAGEISLERLLRVGSDLDREELRRRSENVTAEDPYTIIYTSGTTGPPKGAMLTQGCGASVGAIVEALGFIVEGDVSYLFLPLAHAFALTVQLASFDVGTEIVYFGGDPNNIVTELQETNPTYFPSVPRIFEKIYALATALIPDERQLRKIIDVGVQTRRLRDQGEDVPRQLQFAFDQAEARIYRKVRALFGGRIAKSISGAAPISAEILEFFHACGVPVLEGWGMTETTAVGTINTHDHLRIGSVGRPVPGAEIRIATDGEILIKGPNVFAGYWRDPQATRDALSEDGWLATGDLGSLDGDGYLTIAGRKKDIIITAGGKNIAPANLENDLKKSRWISQAIMYADRRPYAVALIALDPEEMVHWAEQHGLRSDIRSLIGRPEVRELIQTQLDQVNANYASVEQIKKFKLLDHDLSHEQGELTPTLKVKRTVIYERYADLLAELYR
jgi:long-chain acyl-CoA synthetase